MRMLAAAAAAALGVACAAPALAQHNEAAIAAAVSGPWRSDDDRTRDQYRNPAEALAFWQAPAGGAIVEVLPGGGWWTEILAPYAHETGGRYIAAFGDLGAPNVTEAQRNARANFLTRFGDAGRYGAVEVVDLSMRAGLAMPDQSADFILVARMYHNWARNEGATDRFMAEFARVLRPGGVLAVEQHRAADGADVNATAVDGYVPESYVIEAAARAGLRLAARSEINANPADTRDHPFGVWTLPPTRRSAPQGEPANADFDHAPYDAIGESDRMTLRFVRQ